MSVSTDAYSVTGVAGGLWDDQGEAALLAFQGAAGPVNLVLPACELMALLSVCLGLAGESLPEGERGEPPANFLGDWRVGVTVDGDVAMEVAPELGGAYVFQLSLDQAQSLAAALDRAARTAEINGASTVRISSGH